MIKTRTRPLHWTLNTKDESSGLIKINCGTSLVGETNESLNWVGEPEIQKPIIGEGRGPRESKEHSGVHLSMLVINDSNRNGSIEFLVPEIFPISMKFTARATYNNLEVSIFHLTKQDAPAMFVHHKELVANDYEIVGLCCGVFVCLTARFVWVDLLKLLGKNKLQKSSIWFDKLQTLSNLAVLVRNFVVQSSFVESIIAQQSYSHGPCL